MLRPTSVQTKRISQSPNYALLNDLPSGKYATQQTCAHRVVEGRHIDSGSGRRRRGRIWNQYSGRERFKSKIRSLEGSG
jgi:hypothetical protein